MTRNVIQKLATSLFTPALLLASVALSGCGGPGDPGDAALGEATAAAVTGDVTIPDDTRCTGRSAIYLPTAGVTLGSRESYWVCWIAKNVFPKMYVTSSMPYSIEREVRAGRAAAVAWWGLSEGVLNLENWPGRNPLLHSLCGSTQIQGSSSCSTIWQAGLAAGQVNDRTWSQLQTLTNLVYPGATVSDVVHWTADKWASSSQRTTIYDSLSAQGRLAKSWAMRNPALGFEVVYKHEVYPECIYPGTRLYDCYVNSGRPSSAQSRKYAATRTLADNVRSDLTQKILNMP